MAVTEATLRAVLLALATTDRLGEAVLEVGGRGRERAARISPGSP
jgi:hypothetical protein